MKPFLYLFSIVVLASSCSIIEFKQSQPLESEVLNKFPAEMLGTYVDENRDTLVVQKNSFTFGSDRSIFSLDEILTPGRTELKKVNNYFVLNLLNDFSDNQYWSVIPFQLKGDNISVFLLDVDEIATQRNLKLDDVIEEINAIVEVEKMEGKDGKMSFIIDPSAQGFETLLEKGYFIEIGQLQK